MSDPAPRRLYSRAELDELRTYDRAQLFGVLGSFDDDGYAPPAGPPDEAFVMKAAGLLDPGRIPGLADAVAEDDASAVLDAVYGACRSQCRAADEHPSAAPNDVAHAEQILEHRFTFYDETHQLPPDIDWDFNPGTAHWGHDLNRFSYLSVLTRAYFATRDRRFARKAATLILDWVTKCDFGKAFVGSPYVFGSYLNNAGHCEAWGNCVRQLLPEGHVKPMELLRILKSMHDQLAYLEIVTNGHAGNWPTIGCRGILATLAAFPVLRDTDRFIDYCVRTLAVQIGDQVLPDGVQDELTPHYHRCVFYNLITALRSLRQLGRDLDPRTVATLRKMVHYIQQTTMPDGSGQVAFNDSDPGAVADIQTMLAQVGLEELVSPPEDLGPELFPYAGVAFLRQRQLEGDLYLAFDGGPYGRGHQHEDKLGFWLFAYGRSFLVDPGRHLYDSSEASYLAHLRSTRAHSTITIDGRNQHSAGRPETWIPKESAPLEWSVKDGELRASAAYDLGYGDDNAIAAIHRREIAFVKERYWLVFDRVAGESEHLVESRFQFAPCALHVDDSAAHTGFGDSNLLLAWRCAVGFTDIRVEEGQEEPRSGWYSRRYGLIEPAPCLKLSVRTELPFLSAVLLFPYRGTTPPAVSFMLEQDTVTVQSAETGTARIAGLI